MTNRRLRSALHRLRRPPDGTSAEGVSDALLLARFAAARDEAAFELLMWRHQQMVLGVCRRVLRDGHDAEDAFQATFLVLARKAATVGRGSVAGWLYRVAYRCALRARRTARRGGELPELAAPADDSVDRADVRPFLDEAVAGLPDKYRLPVVLCYLQGKTYDDAARELGCPKGTVSTRLTKARELLRSRLEARGLTVPAAALTAVLADQPAPAAPAVRFPAPSTVSPKAAELAAGVLRAMFIMRLKVTAAVLLSLAVVGVAAGLGRQPAPVADPKPPAAAPEPPAAPAKPRWVVKEEGEVWWLASIDAQGGTIEVESCDPKTLKPYAAGADLPRVQIRVAAGAEIRIDGKPAKFGELTPGIPVRLKVDWFSGQGLGKIALGEGGAIHVETVGGRALDGVVEAVAADKRLVTVAGEAGRAEYRIAEGATVTVDGRDAWVGDLKPGMSVSLRLSAVYPVAFGADAVGPKLDCVVRAVDPGKGTVAVVLRKPRVPVTGLTLAEGGRVTLDGKPAGLADLKPGLSATVQLAADAESGRVLLISAGGTSPR